MKEGLTRFIEAQEVQEDGYSCALSEIKNGRKKSHWIWYIFPQIEGLGNSEMCQRYGIRGLDEAKAYLAEPILRSRLVEICEALLSLDANDATEVMGGGKLGRIDRRKLQSSMTLFNEATESIDVFQKVLNKYFNGEKDDRTLKMLGM